MEIENVVRIKGLGKSFKEKHILKDISLDIHKAEILRLLLIEGAML